MPQKAPFARFQQQVGWLTVSAHDRWEQQVAWLDVSMHVRHGVTVGCLKSRRGSDAWDLP